MHSSKDGFTGPDGTASMATLTAPLAAHMAALDSFLASELEHFEPELRDMVSDAFAHSGKRLRPILSFFSGWKGPEVNEALVRSAAIVEMVHLATLVHDDILDGAKLRHGAPTSVAVNGAHAAVLLGDALFSEALCLAADFETTQVCRVVARATRRVCAGEIGQTFARGDSALSLESYYRAIELKTAELFRASCYLGALIGGHGEQFANAAETYGLHLGRAYQIYDDVADLLGDEKAIGKTLGTDLASGKFTLPLLLLLEGRDEAQRKEMARELAQMSHEDIREILEEAEIIPCVQEAFNAEITAAKLAIAPYSALPAFAPMRALAQFVGSLVSRMV